MTIDILLNLLSVFLEILIYHYFFRYFFGKAKFSSKFLVVIYLLTGCLSMIFSMFSPTTLIKQFGYFLIIWIIAICYNGPFFIKLFLPFLFQMISMMIERCYSAILLPIKVILTTYGETGQYFHFFIGIILSNLTILLLIKLLSSWTNLFLLKKQDTMIPMPYYFAVLFVFPPSVFYIIDRLYVLIIQAGNFSFGMILPILLLTLLTILFFIFFDNLIKHQQERHQFALLTKQLEEEQRYHQILLEKHQLFQGIKHDMKHNFGIIADLINNKNYDEAKQFAENQANKLSKTIAIQTGTPLLDTILTNFEEQANQWQIGFHCFVSADMELLNIDIDDLASLLSNALNNAFDAVKSIPDINNRRIWCKLLQDDHYFHIDIQNNVTENIAIENNSIPTTKLDKSLHGFGLMNIRRIAKKYGGTYYLTCADYKFSIKILLPSKMEANE